jgi:hypothetical protein
VEPVVCRVGPPGRVCLSPSVAPGVLPSLRVAIIDAAGLARLAALVTTRIGLALVVSTDRASGIVLDWIFWPSFLPCFRARIT